LWLAATTVVASSLYKSAVVTDHVVTDLVVDICSRVGGFLELSISKGDDLTYDFKCGRHFLKMILTSKSLTGKNTDLWCHKPLYYLYTHCGAMLPPKLCSGCHNY
jgi:hypothetical protein